MPVKKRTGSKTGKKRSSRKQAATKRTRVAAKAPARKTAKVIEMQARKEPVAPPEVGVDIFEVVETEIYEPVVLLNDEEAS